jgi:sugar lactone lactonase YvrE
MNQKDHPQPMKLESVNIPFLALAVLLCCAAPAGADTIYVGDYGGTIQQFNTSGGSGSAFGVAAPYGPFGMAFDKVGNLYVSSYGNNLIQKFDASGVATTFATSGLNHPFDLAFDGSGNLYVANSGNPSSPGGASIMKFNTNGVGTTFVTAGLGYPFGLAFDRNNNLYVANAGGTYSILKYSPTGMESVFISNMAYGPQGLAFDSGGNLFVAESSDIVEYNSSGIGKVFASGLSQPENLAFDSSGNLYVADYGSDEIMKYDLSGVGSVFATLPAGDFLGPVGIAIKPVPEPATWTLMVLGMGAIFGGIRIRRGDLKRLSKKILRYRGLTSRRSQRGWAHLFCA